MLSHLLCQVNTMKMNGKKLMKTLKTGICWAIIFVGFWLIGCSGQESEPPHVRTVPQQAELPHAAPDDWLLAHIDVETTGLIPGYHEMIDIGLVYTTLAGEMLDSLFLRIQPQHPERLSPGAFEVNAFDPDRWKDLNAYSPSAAVDSVINFHKRIAQDKTVLLVAFNSHFDAAFLDHLFRAADRTWRELFYYFVLDIPSMAWGLGFRDLTGHELMGQYAIEDEPHVAHLHTGITGALKNVRLYQALLSVQGQGKNEAR